YSSLLLYSCRHPPPPPLFPYTTLFRSLLLQLRLSTTQQDRLSTSQLLLQAKQVEAPSILTSATPSRVTARSRRNTVVVAALIGRSEEHTSELQSLRHLVCRLLLEKKKY